MVCLSGNPSLVVGSGVSGPEDRTASNICGRAKVIIRFKGKRVFNVYYGMQHS